MIAINNKLNLILVFLFLSFFAQSQSLTGEMLLAKSIEYHDPNGNWEKWHPEFMVELEMEERPSRISTISYNNRTGNFYLITQQDSNFIERSVENGVCETLINGEVSNDQALIDKYRLTCERTEMYRNYYTYLYGLPMKLKDKGTIVEEKVETVEMKGATYLRMRVTYEASVGKDIWYFYFDEKTYALKAYQFYHDEAKNDGEYILLKGEAKIDGINVPKDRTWYYNIDDKLLGTDYLKKALQKLD